MENNEMSLLVLPIVTHSPPEWFIALYVVYMAAICGG